MRADQLLRIDAASEVQRLGAAALEGSWQVPTELVRRALGAGARRVDVEIGPRRVRVSDDGRPLVAERAAAVERLSAREEPWARHVALVALDAVPELQSIVALKPHRVAIERRVHGTSLVLDVGRFDAAAARQWLRFHARFAPAVVVLDGAPLPRGFDGALVERDLASPFAARVAVTAGETACVWLLAHGIVSSRLTLPEAPGFEAVVEAAGMLAGPSTPAALRHAVEPHLARLVDQAVGLMLDAVSSPRASDPLLHLLRPRLLQAAYRGWRRAEVFAAPLLSAWQGTSTAGAPRLCLADFAAARSVACLDPGEDPAAFRMPKAPVLILDAVERARLAQLLGLSFRSLGRRRGRQPWSARLRGCLDAWRQALGAWAERVRHPVAGVAVAEAELSSGERRLRAALRAAITSGAAPPRRTTAGLQLPRRNADVVAAAGALARDERWARAAAIALGVERA